MKVLFVGQLNPVGWVSTTKMRMEAVRDLGHEVLPVDVLDYSRWGGRLMSRVLGRLNWGPPLWRLNRDIRLRARSFQPDLIWVEKGTWIQPRTLAQLHAETGCQRVHYTPDPALVFHQSRHFVASIPQYDLVVTTKSYELDLYRERGARNVLFQYPSFDHGVHRPENATGTEHCCYRADVVFVGTYAPGRERFLRPIAQLGVDLAIWGSEWRRTCHDRLLRRHLRGDGLGGRDYALALGCAKIGLGLLTPLVPDRSTTRSLEIPACGTFLLAERTDEHLDLFEEGKEAEYFSSEGELTEKIQHYLHHHGQRKRVATAGRKRCLRSGYSNLDRVREILERVLEIRPSVQPTASYPQSSISRWRSCGV